MTTFGTYARRVRDPALPDVARARALRGCVTAFHPYGFSATWLRVTTGRRIATHPHGTTRVPDLLAGLAELETARLLWVAGLRRYAERRAREKAARRRVPRPGDQWPVAIAYCPDPAAHPGDPMDAVLTRVIAARAAGETGCPNCRGGETAARPFTGDGPGWRTCARCGIAM